MLGKTRDYIYNADLIRIIDGDTIEVDLDLGFRITQRIPVRLAHINAPEMRTPEGKAAKEHLAVIMGTQTMLLKTFKPKDKYGRYLAEVYVQGTLINKKMVLDGHATKYGG